MPIFELQHPDGRSFQVDAPDMQTAASALDNIGAPQAQSNAGLDIAKQIGTGLVTGTEAIPAAVPNLMGLAGQGVDWLANRFAPGMVSPEAQQQQEQLKNLIAANRGGGVAQYLPQPQTTAGQYARSAAEFVPQMAGMAGSVPRNLAAGAVAGLGSEAAGQATAGTPAEPYARTAGALLAGIPAMRQAEAAAAQRAVPSVEELKARAAQGYEAMRESGLEIKPSAAARMAQEVKADLTEAGLDENVAPKTWGVLGKLEGAPEGAVMTAANLHSLRKTLGNAAGSLEPSERFAAVQAKSAVDDFLANMPKGSVIGGKPEEVSALLKEANANYAAAERAASLDRQTVRAQLRASAANSGMNVANTIRQRMADILLNPKLQRGYSDAELSQMKRIVRGSPLSNIGRFAGNVLGGGGGLGLVGAEALAAGAGYGTGTPELAMLPLAGLGLRGLSNMAALRQVGALNAAVRARSPLAGNLPRFTNPAAPLGLAPALLAGAGGQ